jgi:2-phosphoglycolate phosphatase
MRLKNSFVANNFMSKPLRAVLFDLDGTLVDTAPDFAYVVNSMRRSRDLEEIPYANIREVVSDGSGGLVKMAFPKSDSPAEFESLRQELLTLYRQHLADNSRLFDDMEKVLSTIETRGLRWGVVTNKPIFYAEPLMQALGLSERCGALICPDHVKARKPDPESLHLACTQLNCTTAEAIFIGDHRRDIEAGKNAHMPTIACAYGYVHADDPCSEWNADFIVETVADLLPLLSSLV